MTTAEVTALFGRLRAELAPLVAAIAASPRKAPREILRRDYPVEQQRQFGEAAAAAIGFDFEAGRLDVTTHPFCSGIGPGDCRLTTRYDPRNFSQAFFGTLHEAGHGIYEQNLPAEHFGTPCGVNASLGIHESQSRLWEILVGRGRPFWEHFFPRAQKAFPAALAGVGVDEFYFAVNDVRPSFIRVEADEATYNLHIIVRFELEQALLTGDLAAADVPAAWDETFQSLLGLRPPTAAEGCLQDIHWSMGGIGYFPTYTLGNVYAAQFMEQACRELPGLHEDFGKGQFGRLKVWLVDKVHRAGRRWPAAELCRRVTGRALSHQPLVHYLRGKYGPLYGV
jgi:carboxypeptidase Taq